MLNPSVEALPGGAAPSISLVGVDVPRRKGFRLSVDELDLWSGLTVVTGPNGSGKSTMVECLLGDHRRGVNRLTVGGLDMKKSRERADVFRTLGYAPQLLVLPNHWSVGGYLDYAAWLRGLSRLRREAAVSLLKESMDLPLTSKIGGLSGGMRRRVLVAQALLGDPRYIFFDEPFSGLDADSRTLIVAQISEMAQRGATVLVVDHSGTLDERADRVLRLVKGTVC